MRAGLRLVRFGFHLLLGTAVVAMVYPWIDRPRQRMLKQRWSRQLVRMLGVKLGADKTTIPSGLIVSNHISWLDIFVINALAPSAFVAKQDVNGWPLIGWLCRNTETIFLERGSRAAAHRTREMLIEQLQYGAHVVVFPEGTTTGGDRVLPFHAALFQSAIDAGVPVIPVALSYTDRWGNPSRAPAYDGDITMWQCLTTIARSDRLNVRFCQMDAIDTKSAERRTLATQSRLMIASYIKNQRVTIEYRPPLATVFDLSHELSS